MQFSVNVENCLFSPAQIKKLKEEAFNKLVGKLRSGHDSAVLEAIEEIRNNGDPKILPELASLIGRNRNREVLLAARNVFFDLKNPASVEVMKKIISETSDKEVKQVLVAACWECGLNYSIYLPFFVDLVLDEEYLISIEAFTVIENMPGPFINEDVLQCLDTVYNWLEGPGNENEGIVNSLVEVLKEYANSGLHNNYIYN